MRWSEVELSAGLKDSPEQIGHNEATLAEAALEVAADPATLAAIASAATDAEVVALLKARVLTRFESLASVPVQATVAPGRGIESLGPGRLSNLSARVGEIFDRAVRRRDGSPRWLP